MHKYNARRAAHICAVLCALVLTTTQEAHADLIVNVTEVGGDVVFSASGTINLAGLTFESSMAVPAYIHPANGAYFIGAPSGPADIYLLDPPGITTPSYGSGDFAVPDFGSGDFIGVFLSQIRVPVGYTSGASISANMTYVGDSFSSLGLSPGTYVSTLPNSDTFTLNVTAVPEPSAFALFGIGGMLMLICRIRKRMAPVELVQ